MCTCAKTTKIKTLNKLKFYLHYAVYMETHNKLWYIAHQIV